MQPLQADDILAPIRGEGVRAWRRMTPTAAMPATASLHGSGGPMGARRVLDISMGGLGMQLRRWDQRKLQVGETVHVELKVDGQVLRLQARVVHMQERTAWLRTQHTIGLLFESNVALSQARAGLARYLLRLAQQRPL